MTEPPQAGGVASGDEGGRADAVVPSDSGGRDAGGGGRGLAGGGGFGALAGAGGFPVAAAGRPAAVAGAAGAPDQLEHPLIAGDAGCPSAAPRGIDAACSEGLSCVYRGFTAPVSVSSEPFHCLCRDGGWLCVSSAENGDTTCPIVKGLPTASDPCPGDGIACRYVFGLTIAYCRCHVDESAGAAGAGGDATVASWGCGL